jgi:hypothetical protein
MQEILLSNSGYLHQSTQSIVYHLSSTMMESSTPVSMVTTTTMDTEGGSNTERPASDNGKRRITPFAWFIGGRQHETNGGDYSTVIEDFIHYNDELASRPYCLHRVRQEGNNKQKKCYCLRILGESPAFLEAVAEYQVYFGGMKREEKQKILVEWIRTSRFHYKGPVKRGQDASLAFSIPFLLLSSGDHEGGEEDWSSVGTSNKFDKLRTSTICRDALMDILGLGKATWTTCLTHATKNTLPAYKLKGKKSNMKQRWDEMFFDSLVQHFEDLRKEAGPIATRFVRERTGETTTRDDAEGVEYLAPDFSKRQCYYKYCATRGVNVTANNKGTLSFEAIDGMTRLPTPSWSAYHTFWMKEYATLRVSRPAEDICSYCYVFHNRFRYKQPQTRSPPTEEDPVVEDDGDDDDAVTDDEAPPSSSRATHPFPTILPISLSSDEDDNDDEDHEEENDNQVLVGGGQEVVEEQQVVVLVEEEDIDEETQQSEKAIMDAAEHVKKARAQRLLVNEKMAKAKEDALANTIHSDRINTLIVDYGQNMQLPSFGTSQPGDTYYYTPLNVFNLGCVDVSHPDGEHLYCHIYKEGDGKKGGDNVASLLMKTLRHLNLLQEGCRGKELNVVFDNCPGQNKNHHVLWLVPYLVEMGYFETVNFIFLVVGHTKNAADRRFNNLKMVYRKSNVYTFNQLLEVCGKSPHVTVVGVEDGDFKDYDYFLGLFYCRMAGIKKGHIFSCTRPPSNDGSVYTDGTKLLVSVKESNLDEHPTKKINIVWPKMMLFNADGTEGTLQEAVASRLSLLQRADFLDHLPFQGVPEFKQVQLYNNYRKFIPLHLQDEICPRPSDQVLKRQKQDQKKRLEEKWEKKQQKKLKVM